jgi:hypothetical protein
MGRMASKKNEGDRRRGFLKVLGFGSAAAAAATVPVLAQRTDSAPGRETRREDNTTRLGARYKPNSPDVQAFYRTNRYEH